MRKRILSYSERVDRLLDDKENDINWALVLEEHLIQVGFFQHERLIHLIVTITFAICTFLSIACAVISNGFLIIVSVIMVSMLFPYINHYFLMERQVQKMYGQYDIMLERLNGTKK